jgi:hypothetical protein
MEVRCYDCDSPICPFCVVNVTETDAVELCPTCAAEREKK